MEKLTNIVEVLSGECAGNDWNKYLHGDSGAAWVSDPPPPLNQDDNQQSTIHVDCEMLTVNLLQVDCLSAPPGSTIGNILFTQTAKF